MKLRLRTFGLVAATLAGLVAGTGHAQVGPGFGFGPGPGYGSMWQQLTPEQQMQMWEAMHRWGYGPGMMMGPGMMGPGPGALMTPEQYQQWWGNMQQHRHGLRIWQQLTPEQRGQVLECMKSLKASPGAPLTSESAPSSDAPPPASDAPLKQ
jgi:hypothetical protein